MKRKKSIPEADVLLSIIAKKRLENTLDLILHKSKDYQHAFHKQRKAISKAKQTGLNPKQSKAMDSVLSAANHCGEIYGEAAYNLGLQDGIKLVFELKEFT